MAKQQPETVGKRTQRRPDLRNDAGAVIVVAMVFVMVFTILGVALYALVTSQRRSTEMERSDVKSFNVAEAGVDAGMMALKMTWPDSNKNQLILNDDFNEELKTWIQADPTTSKLWDPSNPDRVTEFVQVAVYDNVLKSTGVTTSVPPEMSERVYWDSNENPLDPSNPGDNRMFVDCTANVDNNRHRIVILAERQVYPAFFDANVAFYAGTITGRPGIRAKIENGTPPVYHDVGAGGNNSMSQHKNSNPCDPWPYGHQDFDDIVSEATRAMLEKIAWDQGTYFAGDNAEREAKAHFLSDDAPGSIIYVKSDTGVSLTGNTEVGTVEKPVLVVLDTPDLSKNEVGAGGTAGFTGIVICLGNTSLWGTSSIHGALYCQGSVDQSGFGNDCEIMYRQDVLDNFNGEYTMSVNIVPNTWQESMPQ